METDCQIVRESDSAWDLEEEHESQGGEERPVDPGVQVLSPGLGQAHVKHAHVRLNLFEEFNTIISPAKSDQSLLRLIEAGLAGEVEGRLGYEGHAEDEEEDQREAGEGEHPPVEVTAGDVGEHDPDLV